VRATTLIWLLDLKDTFNGRVIGDERFDAAFVKKFCKGGLFSFFLSPQNSFSEKIIQIVFN
jgi:hypothetical protein